MYKSLVHAVSGDTDADGYVTFDKLGFNVRGAAGEFKIMFACDGVDRLVNVKEGGRHSTSPSPLMTVWTNNPAQHVPLTSAETGSITVQTSVASVVVKTAPVTLSEVREPDELG